MEETEKIHTRFVVGGVYERPIGFDAKTGIHAEIIYGTMVGANTHPVTGTRQGVLHSLKFAPMVVNANSAELDQWTLIAEPVPLGELDLFRSLDIHFSTLTDALETRLRRAEDALHAIGVPETDRAATEDLSAMSARGRRKAVENGAARGD